MIKIELGRNKLKASQIILGTMRIATMSLSQIEKLINTALEYGINAINLTDLYSGGRCEELFGEVLERNPRLRGEFLLQTKCGIRLDGSMKYYDFSKKYIIDSVDETLKRLKTGYIDCLFLGRPDALMEPEEVAAAFDTLHKSGKVIEFGVSDINPMTISLLRDYLNVPIVANQMQMSCAFTPAIDANLNVNIKNDSANMREGGILEFCRMNNIVIQAYSPLQYGDLEGNFIGSSKYPKLNEVLNRIAKEKEVSPSAVALAWIFRYPGKIQAIIGTTKPDRIREAVQAPDIELTRSEWYEIYQAVGHILP